MENDHFRIFKALILLDSYPFQAPARGLQEEACDLQDCTACHGATMRQNYNSSTTFRSSAAAITGAAVRHHEGGRGSLENKWVTAGQKYRDKHDMSFIPRFHSFLIPVCSLPTPVTFALYCPYSLFIVPKCFLYISFQSSLHCLYISLVFPLNLPCTLRLYFSFISFKSSQRFYSFYPSLIFPL